MAILSAGRVSPSILRVGRLRWIAAALILSAILAGCTAGFLYNRVDLLVSWYVDGLVSLDKDQDDHLRTSVRETLAWHRRTQVPKYIGLLDDLKLELRTPVTAENLEKRYQELATLMDVTAEHIVPEAAPLLRSLRPAQLDELAANLEEDNEDLRKEYSGATPEIRAARRSRNAVRVLQRFVGRLSAEQRALVELRMAAMHDNTESWLERRHQWQQRFLALLRDRPPPQQFEAGLLGMILDPNRFDSADYRHHAEDNRRIVMQMLTEVINGLDPHQKDRLMRKLDEYRENLSEIAARG